jgi:hypothetical protein
MKGKGIASQEVVFERNGKEYTLGLEVALGRAEEGRSVWWGRKLDGTDYWLVSFP